MACGPRAGRRGGAQPDSARVPVGREEEDAPTDRAHSSVAAGGGGRDGLGRSEKVGRRGRFGPRGRKEKERRGWAGLESREKKRDKRKALHFFKIISNNSVQIQIQRIQIQIEQQAIKQCSSA